jgi:hypothetical protein
MILSTIPKSNSAAPANCLARRNGGRHVGSERRGFRPGLGIGLSGRRAGQWARRLGGRLTSATGHAAVGHIIQWVAGHSQPASTASSGAQRTPRHTHRAMRFFFLPHARRKFERFCRISRSRNDYLCERFSPLTRAATVVDLPEARMSDGRGRGGSTRRLHYRVLCASNDPRTEAQRSASTAKATRRRSRSAFHIPAWGDW